MEERVFTVDEKGNITFTDGGQERVLTAEGIDTLKRQAREKILISEAVAKARKQVEEAKSDIERTLAEKNLTEAELMRSQMVERWKKEIKALEKPRTELADHLDNGIISTLTAFFEAYRTNRKKVKVILSNEGTMYLDDIAAKAKEGMEAFTKFLDEKGEQWETVETTVKAKAPEDAKFVMIIKEKDGAEKVVSVPTGKIDAKFEEKGFLDSLRNAAKVTTFQVSGAELVEGFDDIMSSSNKVEAIAALKTAVKLSEIESPEEKIKMGEGVAKEAKDTLSDINREQREHLFKFYDPQIHRINPEDVDFTATAAMGIDMRKLSDNECRSLLAGNLSSLTEAFRMKDGKAESMMVKFRLSKDARGESLIVVHPALKKPVIPQQIMGVRLTDEQRGEMEKMGMLTHTIEVNVNGFKRNVMPYLDPETNQMMLRNYNAIAVPREFEGAKIDDEQMQRLLSGETIKMDNLLDRGGQCYVGYVSINPRTGQLRSVKGADVKYAYQEAANNRGARTEDLKHDKDTFMKSGQTHNDDPKEERPKGQRRR